MTRRRVLTDEQVQLVRARYLASDDARWVTGEIILGSGGMR